eukprot:scaffold161318_cov34-Tisochrysis_lutea.AAC.2
MLDCRLCFALTKDRYAHQAAIPGGCRASPAERKEECRSQRCLGSQSQGCRQSGQQRKQRQVPALQEEMTLVEMMVSIETRAPPRAFDEGRVRIRSTTLTASANRTFLTVTSPNVTVSDETNPDNEPEPYLLDVGCMLTSIGWCCGEDYAAGRG